MLRKTTICNEEETFHVYNKQKTIHKTAQPSIPVKNRNGHWI
jgi:hypothetical protein